MIELRNINKTYTIKKNATFSLKNINFRIDENSLNFVLGKSGCGKTTLLNLLGSIDKPDSGNILLDGKNISDLSEKELTRYRNEYIGYIFQDFNLIPDLTVKENIDLSFQLQKRKISNEQLGLLLKKVDLVGFENRKIKDLSGGQKQRVAIARAIVKKPKLLLCDEPTGALDSKTSKEIFELIKDISKECVVIVVSHDDESAAKYADRIITLHDGSIVSDEIKNTSSIKNDLACHEENKRKYGMSAKFVNKFALKNLGKRPFRLIIALVILSLSSLSVAFSSAIKGINKNEAVFNAMKDNNINFLMYEKRNAKKNNDEIEYWSGYFGDADIQKIKDEALYNGDVDLIYRNLDRANSNFISTSKMKDNPYYYSSLTGTCEIDNEFLSSYGMKLLHGNLPNNDNEIVITKYFYGYFEQLGYQNSIEKNEKPSIDYLVGKTLYLKSSKNGIGANFVISGIVDTNFKDNKFNVNNITTENRKLLNTYVSSVDYGLHNIIFVNKGFYERNFVNIYEHEIPAFDGKYYCVSNMDGLSFNEYQLIVKKENDIEAADFSAVNSKESQSIYLPVDLFVENPDEKIDSIVFDYAYDQFDSSSGKYNPEWSSGFDYYTYLVENELNDDVYNNVNKEFFRKLLADYVYNTFYDVLNKKTIQFVNYCNSGSPAVDIKIGGIHFESHDTIVANEKGFKLISESFEDSLFSCSAVLLRQGKSVKTNIKNYKHNKTLKLDGIGRYLHSDIETDNEYFASFGYVEDVLKTFQQIFTLAIIVLSLFSILFTYYYFSGVVIDRTKEIGILRCLGARKLDIAKIFIVQNLLVCLVSVALSSICCFAGIGIANSAFSATVSVEMNFINIKALYFVIIAAITLAGSFVGIGIPLIKAFSKKPVQTLKANE